MNGNEKIKNYIIAALATVAVVSLIVNQWQYIERVKMRAATSDTVTVTKYVHVKDTAPKVSGEKAVGTLKIPVTYILSGKQQAYSTKKEDIKQETPVAAGLTSNDTISLPLTQKTYTDDSTYTAWVSGYLPSLDSIDVRQKVIETTITNTRTEKVFRRWNIGIQAGYGYGFLHKGFEPYVGIGFTWNPF